MKEKQIKQLENKWEKLSANRRDGFYNDKGFQHSKVYLERLEFIKEMIMQYNTTGELEKGFSDF